jgi:hypothetical protein
MSIMVRTCMCNPSSWYGTDLGIRGGVEPPRLNNVSSTVQHGWPFPFEHISLPATVRPSGDDLVSRGNSHADTANAISHAHAHALAMSLFRAKPRAYEYDISGTRQMKDPRAVVILYHVRIPGYNDPHRFSGVQACYV